jgi:hypothetical protein
VLLKNFDVSFSLTTTEADAADGGAVFLQCHGVVITLIRLSFESFLERFLLVEDTLLAKTICEKKGKVTSGDIYSQWVRRTSTLLIEDVRGGWSFFLNDTSLEFFDTPWAQSNLAHKVYRKAHDACSGVINLSDFAPLRFSLNLTSAKVSSPGKRVGGVDPFVQIERVPASQTLREKLKKQLDLDFQPTGYPTLDSILFDENSEALESLLKKPRREAIAGEEPSGAVEEGPVEAPDSVSDPVASPVSVSPVAAPESVASPVSVSPVAAPESVPSPVSNPVSGSVPVATPKSVPSPVESAPSPSKRARTEMRPEADIPENAQEEDDSVPGLQAECSSASSEEAQYSVGGKFPRAFKRPVAGKQQASGEAEPSGAAPPPHPYAHAAKGQKSLFMDNWRQVRLRELELWELNFF